MTARTRALAAVNRAPRYYPWGWLWGTILAGYVIANLWIMPHAKCLLQPVPLSSGYVVLSKTGEQLSVVLSAHEAVAEQAKWNTAKGGFHPAKELLPVDTMSVYVIPQHSRSAK